MTVSNEDLILAANVEATKRFDSARFSLKPCIIIKKDSNCHVFCRRFFICILLVSTVVLSAIIYGIYQYASGLPDTCHTKECLRSAAAFKQNMNLKVDPCDDFYAYACGNWADDHPRHEDRYSNNWYTERQVNIFRNIRDKLETNTSRSDPKPVNQAKDMYKACVDVDQREQVGFEVVAKYLEDFGLPTLPTLLNHTKASSQNYTFDWISTVAKIQRKLGFNILIGFDVIRDHVDRNRNRLTLGYHYAPGDIGFPLYEWSKLKMKYSKHQETSVENEDDEHKEDDDEGNYLNPVKISKEFKKIVKAISPGFNTPKYESNFKILGEKYVEFVLKLPDLNKSKQATETYDPSIYTVEELQNITDSHNGKLYPIWQHYLDELFTDLPDAKPTAADKLQISWEHIDYMKELVRLVSEEPQETIELFIWMNVTKFIKNHKYNQIETDKECAENVQTLMGLAVSYAIADKDFLEHTKSRIKQMLEDIRLELKEMVLETDWMEAYTKYATVEKLRAMQSLIGFPEWIMDVEKLEQHYEGLHIDRYRYLENWLNAIEFLIKDKLRTWRVQNDRYWTLDPMKVNAINVLSRNAINIPVAIIQYPFYYLGLEALNYGALGDIIGHELNHGIDDSGRHFDKFGIKTRWWSHGTIQEYDKKADCLVKQYSSYYVKEAKGFINGTLTLGENIADNGGLREAFRAYQAYVKRNGPEPMLPGLEDFNQEKLFFISFANLYCGSISPLAGKGLLKSKYSPNEFRVKGVLSNMEEFAEVFKCAQDSKMNPEKKCRVW